MKFVAGGGGTWLLIDEAAPKGANLIATAAGPVEILALKGLCEARLAHADPTAGFGFTHDGRQYRVTLFVDRGNRLSLRIDGSDGFLSRVETEFAFL